MVKMMKKVIALALSAVLLLGLAACGGSGEPKATQSGNTGNNQQGGAPETTGKSASVEVKGMNLTEYTDRDFSYTLLCPDLYSDEQMYSDCWVYQNENYEPLIIFAYSEYYPEEIYFDVKTASASKPEELPEFYLSTIRQIIKNKTGNFPGTELTQLNWKDMSISGLPAAEFRGVLASTTANVGVIGICIIGEKRPYVFWAADVSADQSYLDTAQAVLEACVANFKEGS